MLHSKALRYSVDRTITASQLKDADINQCPVLDQVEKYCQTHHISSMISDQPGFHYKFQHIRQMPYIVYLMGNVSLLDRPLLALVGPRKASAYGIKVSEHLLDSATSYDLATISGLAEGIDTICHQGSLDRQIATIAVLGGGIHHFLQSEKRHLIHKILDHGGLVMSEYKLDTKPTHYTFPQRNRLIAGLAHTVIIPEASLKSGSLITADFAIAHHKTVYGVMNSIFHHESAGVLDYIQQGKIKAVYDIPTVLAEHFSKYDPGSGVGIHPAHSIKLDAVQENIYSCIAQHQHCSIEDILVHSGVTIAQAQTTLSYLEMYDLIFQVKPGIYSISR